jgi:hypothetical protein
VVAIGGDNNGSIGDTFSDKGNGTMLLLCDAFHRFANAPLAGDIDLCHG